MGTISGKILSSMLSASIITTAVGYTGGQYIDTIKSNIDSVTLKAILLNDEAATKIEMANDLLIQKNLEITILNEELDNLTKQLVEANDKIARLELEKTENNIIEEKPVAGIDSSVKDDSQEISESIDENEYIDLPDTHEEPVNVESMDEQQENKEQSGESNKTDDGNE
ncbi:hypothetical protein [Bacillus sp. ISL-55]|uniref:hypothetical protein n=1 Tax=Bacillus sp. ISL-55 TaxID=2819134 RepID=UPI001BE7DF75|nr:hypothetical protein [Bacillus sp. ISL-55]MBT2692580.1 hypothetical protein [Bacillus sp. ISL-55]